MCGGVSGMRLVAPALLPPAHDRWSPQKNWSQASNFSILSNVRELQIIKYPYAFWAGIGLLILL